MTHKKSELANLNFTVADEKFATESLYTFGEPEPVEAGGYLDYLGTFLCDTQEYYVPPISFAGLGKMRHANAQHGSCIAFRRNMTARCYRTGGLAVDELRSSLTDLLTFGNAFIEVRRNGFGNIVALSHIPAINMRVRSKNKGFRQLLPDGKYTDFTPEEVLHIMEYDTNQQIYGMPDWLGGLQSILLNQDATLFRRKYFKNGCHLGYILYTNDPKMTPETRDEIKKKLKEGTGAGNFKTMFVAIPNGGEKAIQLISVGDISQQDEFTKIKELSASDVREAHRVPPVLMGIVPQGTSSLGDPEKMERVYTTTEVAALAQPYLALNAQLPKNLHFHFNLEIKNHE